MGGCRRGLSSCRSVGPAPRFQPPPPPPSGPPGSGRACPPPGGGAQVGTEAPIGSTRAPRGAGRVCKSGALRGCGSPPKAPQAAASECR